MNLWLEHAPRKSSVWEVACYDVAEFHYLHCMPDTRTSYEVFLPILNGEQVGVLVFGRPEATRCRDWYGSVEDAKSKRCEVTRWQVLNLARVLIYPEWQRGGKYCNAKHVPGFHDRSGIWRSALASKILNAAVSHVGFEYLCQRPPCFLDEPYELRWLLSYCNTSLHKGTIYGAAGWELYSTNANGIQTWRKLLPVLTVSERRQVVTISEAHPRSKQYRARRSQLSLEI